MINDALKGLVIGAVLGALVGLAACVWIFTETLFFEGDTMVLGALMCGTGGYFWGEEFFDTLREYWRHLF
jgi:hypothetical protein